MKQPKLSAIIQSHRLTLFGHIMCMDNNADAKRILLASSPAEWRRQLGRPRITWLSTVQQDHHFVLPEAADLAQNCPLEDDVDVWRYAILELHARNDDEQDLMYLLYCVRSMILMPAWSTCRHRRSKRSSSPTAWTCLPRGNDSANTIHGTLPDTEYS